MKIFGIGLSKTGSRSLAQALKLLGYSTMHYPWSLDDIEKHTATLDIPVSCRFKELDILFPGSKFILTWRDYDSWIASTSKKPPDPHKPPIWKLETRLRTYGSLHFDYECYTRTWHRHHEEVMSYFSNRPNDFLLLKLSNPDKWGALCHFLGRDIPDEPYPWEGRSGPGSGVDPLNVVRKVRKLF